jgi:hypothetical protein
MKYDIKLEITLKGVHVEEEKLDGRPYEVGTNPTVDAERRKYIDSCRSLIPIDKTEWNTTTMTRMEIS